MVNPQSSLYNPNLAITSINAFLELAKGKALIKGFEHKSYYFTFQTSIFCCTLLYVHSSFAIILTGKRELVWFA